MMIRTGRRPTGQAVAFLATFMSVLILGVLGVTAFEFSRLTIARDQLRTATDAAALAAAAALAGSDFRTPTAAHNGAITAARAIYTRNDVFGTLLTTATEGDPNGATPPAGATVYRFRFLDPNNNDAEVPKGDEKGKVIEMSVVYGYKPMAGQFLGLKDTVYPIRVLSRGGVPDLDVVLCFDITGSMDNATRVTIMERKWNPINNKVLYIPKDNGVLHEIGFYADRVAPPQWPLSANGMTYNAAMRSSDLVTQNIGQPPGNCPPGTAASGANDFTDIVVNIDDKDDFQGFSKSGYSFPNKETLVEAARGNLESASRFTDSKANTSGLVTGPQPGIREAYEGFALGVLHPMQDAKDAALEFCDVMNTATKCHFGFIAFDTQIGTDENTQSPDFADVTGHPGMGTRKWPLPMVPLDASTSGGHYTETLDAIRKLHPLRRTNIGLPLDKAVDELVAHHRKDSTRAIVFFTDGIANEPSPDGRPAAREAAVKARDEKIPIYTIGLALDADTKSAQDELLNDTNSDPGAGGIAAIAGNGGKYYSVTNPADLRAAFTQVARHLTQLVK